MHMHQSQSVNSRRTLVSSAPPTWNDIDSLSWQDDTDHGHMTIDNVSTGQELGAKYAAWTNRDDWSIEFKRRLRNWVDFGAEVPLSDAGSEPGLGVHLAVAPNGWVYAAWSVLSNDEATKIVFTRSTDGGVIWSTPATVVDVDGIKDSLPPKTFAVGTEPVMAVDTHSDDTTGIIYMVWADERNGHADIMMVKSANGGEDWDSAASAP